MTIPRPFSQLWCKQPVHHSAYQWDPKDYSQKLEQNETLELRTTPSTRSICQLVELCLKSTLFHTNYRIWEQKKVAVLDSPLYPVVANIFIESFEQEALQLAKDKPRLWVRYVDDIFIIWQHLATSHTFETPLSLQWRLRQKGQLPFLDVFSEEGRQ